MLYETMAYNGPIALLFLVAVVSIVNSISVLTNGPSIHYLYYSFFWLIYWVAMSTTPAEDMLTSFVYMSIFLAIFLKVLTKFKKV